MATIEIVRPIQLRDKPTTTIVPGQRRSFTVREYTRLHEIGILKEDERVELIDGGVLEMSPIGPIHLAVVGRLNTIIARQSGENEIVSAQSPVRLNDLSLPQPDVVLLRSRTDGYLKELPNPEDVLLIIEVSDSTIQFDRNEKMPRYAAAGIQEAWLVDIEQQQIEQYSQPNQGTYEKKDVRKIDDEIRSLGSPQIVIQVVKLFT